MATMRSPKEFFSPEGNLSQMGARRLRKEFMMVNNEETFNIRAVFGRNEHNEEVLDIWDLYMECPSGLYDGFELHARIHFPQNYPFQPPTFFFITPMYHPNIYRDGAVCISILHTDKDDITNSVDDSCTWTPGQNVRSICLSIINLLNYPNIYSPANVDASNELRDHEERYKEKVLQLLKTHAKPLSKEPKIEKTEHL